MIFFLFFGFNAFFTCFSPFKSFHLEFCLSFSFQVLFFSGEISSYFDDSYYYFLIFQSKLKVFFLNFDSKNNFLKHFLVFHDYECFF